MAASATTGALNPLLGKLSQLLGDEYKKLTGVRKQASFLKDELSAMKALLDKMELMDKLDHSAKNWRDHIREMSYDMENCIDDFIHDIEGAREKKGFVRKMAQRLRRLGRRHQIASRIEDLKVLAVEANARRERYKIDECINSSHGTVVVDPRITAIYKEAAGLVGIDGPREELVSLLMDSEKKLKVLSIVGFGGLGKTTLAKQVYDEVGGQFNCKAFFSVSQRPDVKILLSGLQKELGMGDISQACHLQGIIDCLREHLTNKRYFIVVDDLWDQQAWDIISCAFPQKSIGSRVMVTTRLEDVATKACQSDCACIYRMTPLKEQDSRKLFLIEYLGLNVSASSAAIALPAEIQSLMHLQTLVVYCKMTQSFPSDISSLANLFHLELPMDIGLPEGIKKMKSLCTLRCWDMLKSSLLEDIKGLGELINLKELYLSTHYSKCLTLEQEDALVSSIEMLRELKRLEIDWVHGCSDPDNQLESLHSPPPRLEELYLIKWEFRRVPKWIGELSCLRILDLHVLHLSSDEVRLLGELPSLVYVSLFLSNVSQGKVVVGMGLFPVLEEFWFQPKKDANAYLSFEAGAMPKLETLALILIWTEWRGATPVGMECLPCLQQIKVWLNSTSIKVRGEVESAFKAVASLHPRQPSVTVGW
ncbi:hypothetical protein ZWY2020_031047 [Hordeum vulgare]|nr:hypothetical protein ZWY2020_031047 [Hordeum vulgare]